MFLESMYANIFELEVKDLFIVMEEANNLNMVNFGG